MRKMIVVSMITLAIMLCLFSSTFAGPPVKTVKWSAQIEQPYNPPYVNVIVCPCQRPAILPPPPPPLPLCLKCIRRVVTCPFRILDRILGG